MVFKKGFCFNSKIFYNKKVAQEDGTAQTNQRAKALIEKNRVPGVDISNASIQKKFGAEVSGASQNGQVCSFKRFMKENELRREFFILEGEEYFDDLSLRGRMTLMIKRSSNKIKNWYFELGLKGNCQKIGKALRNQC